MSEQQTVNTNFVVTRRLMLTGKVEGDKAGQLIQALEHSKGMVSATLERAGKLTLCYDASQTDLDTLLSLCQQLGCQVKQGHWQRLRISWYRFTDQNVRDNARHQPHCCNKPPR